ncbi:MAG: low molecular weight phosphotyrosine protein phosphatase [Deltaproteobacteria bacterium]|nr:low molecular weight phosphotyrosine protein phosphatase [Deltaproteobacteria bacterium]
MKDKTKIMFVCMGNICRSPLAHAVFEDMVARAQLSDRFEIESSGTISHHVGELPDSRMRETASRHGVSMTHRARQFRKADLDAYDMIFAMDADNLSNIRRLAPNSEQLKKVQLFRNFDPDASPNADVPDPYYGGAEGFENVFQIVHRTAANLLESLKSSTD